MLGVDIGGTFTDVVAVENGRVTVKKVPTTPEAREKAVLEGAAVLGVKNRKMFNHASTAGLNAILTRQLPRICFLTTLGHRDMLDMGRAYRPWNAQTDPNYRKTFGDASRPLIPRYLRRGIKERILSSGEILIDLDVDQAKAELETLKRQNVEGVAICLLNAYVNSRHERMLRDMVKEVIGDVPISISSEVSPLAREYTRASTTVVDAIMKITFTKYIGDLVQGLQGLGFQGQVNLADCAATLSPWETAMLKPFNNVFSGPAAGTVSSAYFGNLIGEDQLICADIGGTSTDLSLVRGGRPTVRTEFELEWDLVVNTLANEVISIGAGGGSIVHTSGAGQLLVGPESVGADPGPACYNKGGRDLSVTDILLLIGILDADKFLGGDVPLYPELAKEALGTLDVKLNDDDKVALSYGIILNNIGEGIRDVCLSMGADPRDCALVACGAAGPTLLPAVAEDLQVKKVIVPPHPGAFSALGLLSSDLVFSSERTAYTTLSPEQADSIGKVYEDLEQSLINQVGRREGMRVERSFDGMYMGQTWTTSLVAVPGGKVTAETIEQMIANFNDRYEKRAGNKFPYLRVVGVTYRCRLILPLPKVVYEEAIRRGSGRPQAKATRSLSFLKNRQGTPIVVSEYERADLRLGDVVNGPAIIREPMSTTYIVADQKASVGKYGELHVERR